MKTFTDYYTLLGVAPDASPEAIKAAFKKLALQYHPDVYKGVDANERMSQLLQAYQTLNTAESRRHYDAQRSEHLMDGSGPASNGATYRPRPAQSQRPTGSTDVSPGAKRDRQRHYAFPTFVPGKPVQVHLGGMAYALTAADVQALSQDGLLRGEAYESSDQHYFCHRCHHRWNVQVGKPPRYCPNCHATDWPEYLLLHCIHCNAVFESEQIRYEIGSYAYGQSKQGKGESAGGLCPPYELFPLCPYCATAHWSPAEEVRVSDLRQKASRRSQLIGLLAIGVVLLLLMLIFIIVLGH